VRLGYNALVDELAKRDFRQLKALQADRPSSTAIISRHSIRRARYAYQPESKRVL